MCSTENIKLFVLFCRTAPLKENRKSKKNFFEKRGPQCLLSLSVCVCVCLSVCLSACVRACVREDAMGFEATQGVKTAIVLFEVVH